MSAADEPFLLAVADVFVLRRGRALAAAGRIERGRVAVGDEVEAVGPGGGARFRVAAIDGIPVTAGRAEVGANVGLLLGDDAPGAVRRGHVLAAPGSIRAHDRLDADLTVFPEEDGGIELATGSALELYAWTAAANATVLLPDDGAVLRPAHGGPVSLRLDAPVALEPGLRFPFRCRGRAAGSGTVLRLPG